MVFMFSVLILDLRQVSRGLRNQKYGERKQSAGAKSTSKVTVTASGTGAAVPTKTSGGKELKVKIDLILFMEIGTMLGLP